MAQARGGTTTRRHRSETRALIVGAAEECLRERRIRELRVEEIMEAAGPGLSRTLFYRHFDDVFDLVARVSEPAFDDLFAEQGRLAAEPLSYTEGLARGLGVLVEAFVQRGPIIRALRDASSFDSRAEAVYEEHLRRFVSFAAAVLRRQGLPDDEAAETARALVHMDLGYLIDCFGGVARATPEVAHATLVAVWTARCRRP